MSSPVVYATRSVRTQRALERAAEGRGAEMRWSWLSGDGVPEPITDDEPTIPGHLG